MARITQIHFQSIPVTDIDRAIAFYRERLGLKVERNAPYGESRWVFMQIEGAQTLLHFDHVDEVPERNTPALVLNSDDVDGLCSKLQKAGVTITQEPQDAPWEKGNRWAMLRDSEGNQVLVQTMRGD